MTVESIIRDLLAKLPSELGDWQAAAPYLTIVVVIGIVFAGLLTGVAYGILVERWVAAAIQNRHGPNRVGPWGLFQPVADGLKPLLKEDVVPRHADRFLFLLAPALAAMTSLMAFAVVPFGPTDGAYKPLPFQVAPTVDIGILYIFATGSMAVYAVILAGWASNNKYSFLGALRSSAQVISYEIPLGMSILGVVLLAGSLNLERIVAQQAAGTLFFGWNIFIQPLAFLIFMTAALAEANRLPFDLPECEQELVGGYHTEYSAMKFALFMLGEYIHMITVAFLLSTLFLGGWHFPIIATPGADYPFAWLVKCGVLAAKAGSLVIFFMFIRWTIPRFRFDQLMGLAWKTLLPLSLANLLCAIVVKQFGLGTWLLLPMSAGLFLVAGLIHAGAAQHRVAAPRRAALQPA
jgi:NADH-quinone oxidoreductase subunit H